MSTQLSQQRLMRTSDQLLRAAVVMLLLSSLLPLTCFVHLPTPLLDVFVGLGTLGLFGSPILLLLSLWELLRYQRSWRLFVALAILSVATAASMLSVFYVVRRLFPDT